MISPNPIITILVSVCFILAALQITCNCYIGMTRIMVGMSLDRTLPAWFSKVNPRFRSPVNAHLIYFLLGCVAIYGYNYWALVVQPHPGRDVRLRLRLHDQLSRGRAHAVSRQGAVRRVSGRPVHARRLPARHHLRHHRLRLRRKRPVAFLTNAGYGLKGHARRYIIVASIFVICLVGYWIGRQYNKSQGIDVNYAFLEVPPE